MLETASTDVFQPFEDFFFFLYVYSSILDREESEREVWGEETERQWRRKKPFCSVGGEEQKDEAGRRRRLPEKTWEEWDYILFMIIIMLRKVIL
jgi:hypothetical protein